jgi:hypothetical protein
VAAERSSDDRQPPLDSQVLLQPTLDIHHVVNGDEWEMCSPGPTGGRVDGSGPGRSTTASEQIRTDNEQFVRVQEPTRPNQRIPPTGIIIRVVPRDMGVTRNRVADQHRIIAGSIELPKSFERNRDGGEQITVFQLQWFVECHALHMLQRCSASNGVAAFEEIFRHVPFYSPQRGLRSSKSDARTTSPGLSLVVLDHCLRRRQ